VSISLGLQECGCNFAPLKHWERLRVRWQHLNADVVRARGLMRANSIGNSSHITPCDDRVHQPVTATVHEQLLLLWRSYLALILSKKPSASMAFNRLLSKRALISTFGSGGP
jgi:hypothetical protein